MRSSLLYSKKRVRRTKRKPGYGADARAEFERAHEQRFGSQGGASPVRKIDLATGEVIGIIKPRPSRS